MAVLRVVTVLALLVAIWYGYRLALVLLLAWHAAQLWSMRQELFYQQEDDAMRRLSDYWKQLIDRRQT
jgi:hypothetical protein